jgi:two-component system, cell cycle response regulator
VTGAPASVYNGRHYEGGHQSVHDFVVEDFFVSMGHSVLVADDNVLIRNIVADLLRAMGFEVTEAEDGLQALQLYRSNRFHIVITDWVMPNMTGVELCQAIRADNQKLAFSGYSYIIMLTSQDSKNDLIVALDAGADDYLVKPVHKPELQARIRTAMRIIALEKIREAHLEQVRKVSLVDALTGVHNRKFIDERLPLEIKRANRYLRPLSVMLIDFNSLDEYRKHKGILAAEGLLQGVSAVLKDSIRQEVDWVARWSDYEFLVLLPETEVSDACTVAKRLRLRVNQLLSQATGDAIKVLPLYGIVGFVGNQAKKDMEVERLLEFVQQALTNADPATQIGGIKLG